MTSPGVIALIPTRGRVWMIGRSVDNLLAQGVDKILFLSEEDASLEEVKKWGVYGQVYGMPAKGEPPAIWQRPDYSIAWIGELRNQLSDYALYTSATHFLHICSDIWLQPGALGALLGVGKPVVGANVRFSKNPGVANFMIRHPTENRWTRRVGLVPRPNKASKPYHIKDGFTAACVLAERRVFEAGCKFGDDPSDEMAPFCQDAIAKGFEVWWQPKAKTVHWMAEDQVWMS